MPKKRVYLENKSERLARLREGVKKPTNEYDEFVSPATLEKDRGLVKRIEKFFTFVKGTYLKKEYICSIYI